MPDNEGREHERATGEPFALLARRFALTLPYHLSLVDEADRLS